MTGNYCVVVQLSRIFVDENLAQKALMNFNSEKLCYRCHSLKTQTTKF